MKGLASWDTVDFSSSSDIEIVQKLKDLNIPLSVEEAKKVQFSFLKRPATLTELVLFSIQVVIFEFLKYWKNFHKLCHYMLEQFQMA